MQQYGRIRRVSGNPVQHRLLFTHCFLLPPPLFFYLHMLCDDALVDMINCCNLYYTSYIKKKPLNGAQGPYFACLLLLFQKQLEKS